MSFLKNCLTLQHYNMPVLMIDLVTLNQPKTHILIICVYILTVSQLSLLFILYIFCLHNFWSDKLLKDNFVNFEIFLVHDLSFRSIAFRLLCVHAARHKPHRDIEILSLKCFLSVAMIYHKLKSQSFILWKSEKNKLLILIEEEI